MTDVDQNWARRFFTLWTGQALSLLGSQLVQFAIIWYLTQSTQSATVLAIASMMGLAAAGDPLSLYRHLGGPREPSFYPDRCRHNGRAGNTGAGDSLCHPRRADLAHLSGPVHPGGGGRLPPIGLWGFGSIACAKEPTGARAGI